MSKGTEYGRPVGGTEPNHVPFGDETETETVGGGSNHSPEKPLDPKPSPPESDEDIEAQLVSSAPTDTEPQQRT